MDAINGVTMEKAAALLAKHTQLRSQFGEPEFKPHWHQHLASLGLNEHAWAEAWNAWHTRLESDPSGKLWARFSMLQSQQMMSAHYSDVRDMSQDEQGGITLDVFAKVGAELTVQPGISEPEQNAIIQRNGLSLEQWARGRDAWNEAMTTDRNIGVQYGQLYMKYNPAHQQRMEEQMAAQMAARPAAADVEDEEEEDVSLERWLRDLESKTPRTRWDASRHVSRLTERMADDDPARYQSIKEKLVPVLLEALERHDKDTTSSAESAVDCLTDHKVFTDDVKSAMGRALNRARESLQTTETAFAPIANKNVPERIFLQQQLQSWRALKETLEGALGEWDENVAKVRSERDEKERATAAPVAASPASVVPRTPRVSVGPIGMLLALIRRLFGL